jgi:hypothetical protein
MLPHSLDGVGSPCDLNKWGLKFSTCRSSLEAREISDSVLLKRLLLRIARGRVCHLREEGQKLEHGNPERPLSNGAELASETGDG